MSSHRLLARAALLSCLALFACTYMVETSGDGRFVGWRAQSGEVSVAEVVEELGPPGAVRTRAGRLYFFYSFRELVETRLVLRYYLDIFKLVDGVGKDSELVLIFDDRDRLLYSALSRPD